jgi:tryptophan halogenase
VDFFFRFLPDRDCDPRLIDEYNRRMIADYEEIRDFIVLHYCTTDRTDTPFWERCRTMRIPDSLQAKIDLFKVNGTLREGVDELFRSASWQSVMDGMGIRPRSYHKAADMLPPDELTGGMQDAARLLRQFTEQLPTHGEFLATHCAAPLPQAAPAAAPAAALRA